MARHTAKSHKIRKVEILVIQKQNFCDGCDCEFESVADWESDMMQEMAQY